MRSLRSLPVEVLVRRVGIFAGPVHGAVDVLRGSVDRIELEHLAADLRRATGARPVESVP